MTVKQLQVGSPFLIDETGDIVAVRSADGTVTYLAFVIPTATTPVDGVQSSLTTDMTNANADITLTAVAYGSGGDRISVTYVDPSANDAVLAVTVSGFDITVSLATNGSGTITSTADDVVTAIGASAAASALVTATAEGDGSGVVEAVAQAYLAGGVNVTAGPVGTLAFDSSNIYIKDAAQNWVSAPLTTNSVQKIEVEVDASAGGVAQTTTICTVPAGAVLMGVIVRSIMAFDGDATTTFDVGVSGDTSAYISSTDFDPSVSSSSACNIGGTTNTITTLQYLAADETIIATWTNDDNASEGTVKVVVLYR